MLVTDKSKRRRELEAIAGDLRHAYSFLSTGALVPEGQRNVAGLIERQIRRLERMMVNDDKGLTP